MTVHDAKGGLKSYVFNDQTGEIHRERKHGGEDNIPKDYYKRDNYHLLKAQNEDKAKEKALVIWSRLKSGVKPDLCGHEYPEKSKE